MEQKLQPPAPSALHRKTSVGHRVAITEISNKLTLQLCTSGEVGTVQVDDAFAARRCCVVLNYLPIIILLGRKSKQVVSANVRKGRLSLKCRVSKAANDSFRIEIVLRFVAFCLSNGFL